MLRLAAPALLGLSMTYWSQSTEPEVYTLAVFLSSLSIYLLSRFIAAQKLSLLLLSLCVYSLSFGNHLTTLMSMPAFFLALALSPTRRRAVVAVILVLPLLVLFGLGQYVYIYYLSHQGGPYLEYVGRDASVSRIVDYVLGGQFKGLIGSTYLSPRLFAGSVVQVLRITLQDFGLPLTLLLGYTLIANLGSLISALRQGRCQLVNDRSRQDGVTSQQIRWLLVVAASGHILYAISYPIHDVRVYYLVPYALLLPVAMSAVEEALTSGFFANPRQGRLLVVVGLVATLSAQLYLGYKSLKLFDNPIDLKAREIVSVLPEGASVFIDGSTDYSLSRALWYHATVGQPSKRLDVKLAVDAPASHYFTISDDKAELIEQSSGREVQRIKLKPNGCAWALYNCGCPR
ncbi:hypothetical protein SYNGFB01_04410 [Synechococcus sp. GFB01]|nr:hypothetical protein SYNGFB01_04410 [Synechococcus sp. GFB01]